MPTVDDPRALVTAATRDDAAVFRLSDERTIVASVDFFTPIVDDPYAFGAIAAANAFSDLYAMGATPLFALNLVGWPRSPEMLALLEETLRGSAEVTREAGAFVLGGHSIDDEEPKFGLVAIGEAHVSDIITIGGAEPGDHLVLTKPIGTGILSTALKRELISESEMADAIAVMRTLNAGALRAIRSVGGSVHAVTDVTGFGLIGHLWNILSESRVSARLWADMVPLLPLAPNLAAAGAVPGGSERNREAASEWTDWRDEIGETERILLCDAQTSGGLLIAVQSGDSDRLVGALNENETPAAVIIGEIVAGEPPRIGVTARGE